MNNAQAVLAPAANSELDVLLRDGEVALVRRPPKGLLGGMLGLPTTDWTSEPPKVRPGPQWRAALALCGASIVGASLGSWLLLTLDNASFRALVPWLLLAATLLFAAGPWLKPRPREGQAAPGSLVAVVVQCVTAVYGGFFGAGVGVMMLATLGLTRPGDYHQLNALKTLLSIVIAAVAVVIFVARGVIAWTHALVMIPGVMLGGWVGVWAARRMPQAVVRTIVCAVGLALAGYYFWVG